MIRQSFLILLAILLLGVLATGCDLQSQPKGWSGGVLANGTLFLGSVEGKLVAVDVSSHNRLWADVRLKTRKPASTFGCAAPAATVAIYGTPTVSGGLVYVGGYNGKLYAFDAASGNEEWTYPPEKYLWSIVGGPVVSQGKVFFGCSNGRLYALDADTGDKQWEFETGGKVWATPAIHGDTLYIGSFDKKLYAIDITTGKKTWEYETEGVIVATPLVDNGTVYVGSFDRYFYALDAATGSLKWRSSVEAGNWFWAKPVAANGVIYAGCLDHKVYALDAKNGSKTAEFDLGSPVVSSPVLIGNTVILAAEAGKVYSLDTVTREIKPLAQVGEKIHAPLHENEGDIYIHAQEPATLYVLRAETGVTLWSLPLSNK